MPDMMQASMPAPMPMADVQYIGPAPDKSYGVAKTKLIDMSKKDNLADGMSKEELRSIGMQVVNDYQLDEESRKEWLARNQEAIKLANQVREDKTFPWPGAANIKLPLIADAAIKFAARAYSEIIRDDKVVKGEVIGPDPDGQKEKRAQRVGTYMSWQLLKNMKEWESDTDKLLHVLPVVGHLFRKTHYSPALKRNKSEMVMPDKLCINNSASSIEDARRKTHILENTHMNTVVSNQRAGVWLDVKFDQITPEQTPNEPEREKYYTFLEQHTYLDLDDDGYEEPYIITVEKNSSTVVRILANYEEDTILENKKGQIQNIEPCQYFASYPFIPSLDGSFYAVGFGILLCPLNETANTLFNQLLDAGTMSILGGGFLSKEIKVKSGNYRFAPNEWKKTDATAMQLKDGVVPLPTRTPDATLFQLLGMVIEMAKDLASVKDVLAGDVPGMNTPATTVVALIEQGMKTFNAIYKRIYRSLGSEFGILFKLNYRYMDEEEYYKVLDEDAKVYREDFNGKDCDILPVADPNLSSDMQRMARVQAMNTYLGQPGVNPKPIQRYGLEALRLPDALIDEILPEQDPMGNPEAQKLLHDAEMKMADVQNKERELDLKEREFDLKVKMAEYDAALKMAQAEKALADAEAVSLNARTGALAEVADSMHRQIEGEMQHEREMKQMDQDAQAQTVAQDQQQQQIDQQAQQPEASP
jgi:chaperonin GroES